MGACTRNKVTLLAGVAIAVSSSGAYGASSPPAPSEATGTSQPDIIVTAQKRKERLIDVPVSVTAIDANALAKTGQVRLQDYYAAVPGLSISVNDYGLPQIAIRGITTVGENPTVGITVDDVPFGSSSGLALGNFVPDMDPSDLAQIEILRGPQGTLYGAASIGGLIKYITVDPSTDRVSGRVEIGGNSVYNGNGLGYNARAAANVPLSSNFAIRASGFVDHAPGYVDDPKLGLKGVNDRNSHGGRLSAFWRISPETSIKMSALVQQLKAGGVGDVDRTAQTDDNELVQDRIRNSGLSSRKLQAYSVTARTRVGNIDLTSISGYNNVHSNESVDYTNAIGGLSELIFQVPGGLAISNTKTQKFTQELRATAPLGKWADWIVGGFYTHEKSLYTEFLDAATPSTGKIAGHLVTLLAGSRYSDVAAFGDVTFHLTKRFDLQVGARESFNRQSYSVTDIGPIVPLLLGQPSPYVQPTARSRDHAFTYLLTPKFQISRNAMVYARLASGYGPGGPNLGTQGVGLPRSFGPQTTKSYEIGTKGKVLDDLLTFDISAYYIDWSKIQLYVIDVNTGLAYETNGGSAKSQGLEASLQVHPLPGLSVAGWATLSKAVLTEDFPATAELFGRVGDRLPFSSRFSGNLSVNYEFPLRTDITATVGATEIYVGKRYGLFVASPDRQTYPGYAQTNVHVAVTNGLWTAEAFMNNAFDRRGILDGGIGTYNPDSVRFITPRTVGVTVSRTF